MAYCFQFKLMTYLVLSLSLRRHVAVLKHLRLQIDKEKVFIDISQRHADAMCWEEKANHVLETRACMSDFEDILRASEHIGVILPSLLDVKLAVSTAKAWLTKSKPFLFKDSSIIRDSNLSLQVDVLKDLVLESEDLKIYFEECSLLEQVLNECKEWEQDASSLLQNVEHLWNLDIISEDITSCLIPSLECQVLPIETAIKAGISLGLEFKMIPNLQDTCSLLKWCIKALSFSTIVPTLEELDIMLDTAANLPLIYKTCALWTALIDGLGWLKKSLEILYLRNRGQFQVSSVEELLVSSKKICIPFPIIINRLQDAVQDHSLWLEQVHRFFRLVFEDRSWNILLQLKEDGNLKAFSCVELEKVLFELDKVQKWKQRCVDIIKPPPTEKNPLLSTLIELNDTLRRSFEVYSNCRNGESRNLCICCSNALEDHDLMTCSICKDRTDERRVLHQIVEKAIACNDCFVELVNFALAYIGKDLDVVTRKLCIATKAMHIAGICDEEGNCKFQLALARNSWKNGADNLLRSAEKPTLQQIQHYLKKGLTMNIPPEDYFTQRLTEFRDMALQWADTAKKVAADGGVLGLDRVFELISEGENLPISCEKDLKLLRDRSMLYCICRKPYDQRAMIACDKCDEWYHFDCIKISSAPKVYICPACGPHPNEDVCASTLTTQGRFTWSKFEEPQTPLRRFELSRKPAPKKAVTTDMNDCQMNFSSTEGLLWRNRKPFRRAARKRTELENLSPLFRVQNN